MDTLNFKILPQSLHISLHIHPSQATEEQYDYFLDCWSGDDEYQYLYDYYENKYPEYNNQLKHYGK